MLSFMRLITLKTDTGERRKACLAMVEASFHSIFSAVASKVKAGRVAGGLTSSTAWPVFNLSIISVFRRKSFRLAPSDDDEAPGAGHPAGEAGAYLRVNDP